MRLLNLPQNDHFCTSHFKNNIKCNAVVQQLVLLPHNKKVVSEGASLCGPAMSWWLVQGVTLLSHQ